LNITEPGIYEVAEEAYHADPCAEPSLSRSCLRELLVKSPKHVRFSHPKMFGAERKESESKFDLGSAAHSLLLEGIDKAQVIDAADWRTSKAKEQREEARVAGKLPFLVHQYEEVLAMVEAAKQQIPECSDLGITDFYKDGKAEQTLIWQEDDAWCRVRPDWWSNDRLVMLDYKTADTAQPEEFHRKAISYGYDIQDAFYTRGAYMLTGIDAKFFFVVQETSYPYICSFIALDPQFKELGHRKMAAGIEIWQQCMSSKRWPGYPSRVCHISAPAWELAKWEVV
jgi:hypothetical protein